MEIILVIYKLIIPPQTVISKIVVKPLAKGFRKKLDCYVGTLIAYRHSIQVEKGLCEKMCA